ncbi:MAG: hypothetical protein RSC96_07020 [Oscillospiraceae bacterium]
MKLMIFVLNDVEKLEAVLAKLEHEGVRGATILPSRGMAMALENYMEGSFLGSLRAVMEPDREENKTVFAVIKDDQINVAVCAIESVIGSLDDPNTGIIFTLPVDFVKGLPLGGKE